MKLDLNKIDQSTVIKGVLILLVIVGLYFLLRKAIKSIKSDQYQKDIANEIQSDKLSYSLNQYVVFSEKLSEILFPLNTDEDALYSIMSKMNTLSDVLQLNKAYGMKGLALKWGEFSLVQAFVQRLSADEIEKVNSILKSKNINFSF